ncbi:MAG: GNAT family N-acetyltransferase [Henriciella sp.]|nr:GNAT family N-acetyltransferase [Henriciella sp.]
MTDITQVGPEFAQRLADLWATTFNQAYCDLHTAENIAAYCATNFTVDRAGATLADQDTVCKIAGPTDAPLGFYVLCSTPCPIPTKGSGFELKQIYLLEAAYGTGLGRRLFDDAVDTAGGLGADHVWLGVSDRNPRAQRFYQKLGFDKAAAGPVLEVGSDRLPSSIMVLAVS